MSKRCPECRFVNEDSRIFCASCGAALDSNIRLIQNLERGHTQEELPQKERGDVNFYVSHKPAPQKKKSAAPWILLLIAVAAVALWFFLK